MYDEELELEAFEQELVETLQEMVDDGLIGSYVDDETGETMYYSLDRKVLH